MEREGEMHMYTRHLLFFVLLSCFICTVSLAGEPAEPALKTLVITGGHGFDLPAFGKVFDAPRDIEWKHAVYGGKKNDANAIFSGDGWKSYDVFVFYDMVQNLPESTKKGISSLCTAGKGIVMLHHTLAANQKWPEYSRIVGGKYLLKPETINGTAYPQSTYKHGLDIDVAVPDPAHPITWGIKPFTIHDETYNHYYVAPNVTPLLTTDHPTSEKVIAWTHNYRNSRVVFIQHGHDAHAYRNPVFKTLVARSIRYTAGRPAAAEITWQTVFNGKDIDNWKATGNADWSVRDGALTGKQGPDFAPGDLFTKKEYDDFEAKVSYRVKWPANTGIWFRYQSPQKAYQADILEWKNPKCWSGTLYCPGKMFLDMNTDPSIENKKGWNSMIIRAAGSHLVVFLNGRKTCDVYDGTNSRGSFGIQVHPGKQFGPMQIEVREFKVRKL